MRVTVRIDAPQERANVGVPTLTMRTAEKSARMTSVAFGLSAGARVRNSHITRPGRRLHWKFQCYSHVISLKHSRPRTNFAQHPAFMHFAGLQSKRLVSG